MAMIRLLAQPAKQKQLKLIVSVFWCMDGLPRFDGPVLISNMRILGPPLTPAPNGRFGSINGPVCPEIQLPLFPRERTQVGHWAMSEMCHELTLTYGP
jgi:hypothetical protein